MAVLTKHYFLCALSFITALTYSAEKNKSIGLTQVADGLVVATSINVIARAGVSVARSVVSHINPDKKEQYKTQETTRQINCLKAEEEFNKCLILHARAKRPNNGFPKECDNTAQLFASLAGSEHLTTVKLQFLKAVESLEADHSQDNNEGMSIFTKGLLFFSAAGLVIVAAPIVLPGTIVAAKASAIIASTKTACAAASAKISASAVAGKVIVVGTAGTVLELEKSMQNYTTKEIKRMFENISKLPFQEKIILSAHVIDTAHMCLQVRPYIFRTQEEELDHLYDLRSQRPSLIERIQAAYAKKG